MEPKKYHSFYYRAPEAKDHIKVGTRAQHYRMADLYYTNDRGEKVYGVPGVAAPAVPPSEAVYPTKSCEPFVELMVKFWGDSLRYVKGGGLGSPGEWLYRSNTGGWVVGKNCNRRYLDFEVGLMLSFVYAAAYATIEREILGAWEVDYKGDLDAGETEQRSWHTSVRKLYERCDEWKTEYVHMVLKPEAGRLGKILTALSRHPKIATSRAEWRFPERWDAKGRPRAATYIGPN